MLRQLPFDLKKYFFYRLTLRNVFFQLTPCVECGFSRDKKELASQSSIVVRPQFLGLAGTATKAQDEHCVTVITESVLCIDLCEGAQHVTSAVKL